MYLTTSSLWKFDGPKIAHKRADTQEEVAVRSDLTSKSSAALWRTWVYMYLTTFSLWKLEGRTITQGWNIRRRGPWVRCDIRIVISIIKNASVNVSHSYFLAISLQKFRFPQKSLHTRRGSPQIEYDVRIVISFIENTWVHASIYFFNIMVGRSYHCPQEGRQLRKEP